jgi:trk system potassium uptake protein TrkA
LIEKLHNTLIITGDPGNIDLLKEEGLGRMDAFIAVTPNSETNIISSLMAEEMGVEKTIALVDNTNYTHISRNIGVDTIINKKLIAANNIFRFVRKGKIEALTSLHGVNAEVIEFVVHRTNRLTRHPIRELHFPEKALIGSVIRNKEALIPNGDFQLEVNDKVIVFALPEAISQLEKLFR